MSRRLATCVQQHSVYSPPRRLLPSLVFRCDPSWMPANTIGHKANTTALPAAAIAAAFTTIAATITVSAARSAAF